MARLERISNTKWKQPFADREKEFGYWRVPRSIVEHCKIKDRTQRLLRINFGPEVGASFAIEDTFTISSGKEVLFPASLKRAIEPIVKDHRNSYFTIEVLDGIHRKPVRNSGELHPTVAVAEVEVRLRQAEFRRRLLQQSASCFVTGITTISLLRASHIKPWAVASEAERVDPENGLLLGANIDAAFDVGLITFADSGVILFASKLSTTDALALGLGTNMKLGKLTPKRRGFLKYHRENVFAGA